MWFGYESKRVMKIKIVFFSLLVALLLAACVDSASVRYGDSGSHYKKGPPPHAPAHGYRHKYHNHDMIYDSGVDVYVVVGWQDHYFDNGFYFRYRDGRWQISATLSSDWKDANERDVPKKLFKSKGKKSKSHPGKGKDKKKKWDD